MFFKSLQWRLVLIILAITISLMIFVGVFLNSLVVGIYYNIFRNSINQGFETWDLNRKFTFHQLEEELNTNKIAIRDFSINEGYKSYAIIDKNGKVLFAAGKKYDEDNSGYQNSILSSGNLLKTLAQNEIGTSGNLNRVAASEFYDYARRITLISGDYVILYFRYDKEAWNDTIKTFNNAIINSLLFAILISLIIGYVLSKTITTPLVSLMHKARQLAKGDFEHMLEVKSNDEIGKLTHSFNYMAKALKNTLSEVTNEKKKIETIFNYMSDGVIAFNNKGEVIHKNPTAVRMLGLTSASDYNFNVFSKQYGLDMNLEELNILEDFGAREKDIEINERFLKVFFELITNEQNKTEVIIAVFHDITEQTKLDNMRKDFVANVSHELRTPLTSIKSYTETLLDGAMEDKEITEKFLNVVNSEADRMTRLVKDLLQLSRIDNQQMQWNFETIDFMTLVRSCIERMQIEARNKNQILESHVIGEIPIIKADHDRIEQVVFNLLSNAIKYTPEGGKITIYIGRMYSEVYVKVSDTGIGIPVQDLPRIFERFYRVDKARSREMGGTGLGLAIAKEIVEAHGGSIMINSEYGKGTEVTAKLSIEGLGEFHH